MKTLFLHSILLFSLLGTFSIQPRQQDQTAIEYRNVQVENKYPEGIVASIEVCGRPADSKVVFHYKNPADFRFAWQKDIWTLDKGDTAEGCEKRQYVLETQDIEVPPFSILKYYWTVDNSKGTLSKSPTYLYYYKDERYQWKNIENDQLRIWWHDRPDQFGRQVLLVAETAMKHQQKFYGYSLAEPVTVVILNTSEEFFAWQAEADYAAGLAFPEIYLTVQMVEDPQDFGWLDDVVPHEISHLYYDNLVTRVSGAPYWLDEGMATYSEYSDHSYDWEVLQDAAKARALLSLDSLDGRFDEEPDTIDIAYAESYYAVLYMKEVYGEEAIERLLADFHNSQSADQAYQNAFGKSPENFFTDYGTWLETRLKTPPPVSKFPRSGPAMSGGQMDPSLPWQQAIFFLTLAFLVIIFLVFTRLSIHRQKSRGRVARRPKQ